MKFKFFILFVFISVYQWLFCFTWHIKQDGTGNFTAIQEGIIAATDSDTVLVYPGTYYENIDYLEKSLTVASLYIITPEDSLINQTIIDGNQQFRCVTIEDCDSSALIGFSIQNGLAYGSASSGHGGGIKVWEASNLLISNCYIRNNKSIMGGGIFIHSSNVDLIGNCISRNWGIEKAGGILIGNNTNLQFSEIELNNIYLNYSGTGSELYISVYSNFTQNIIVDTFTVSEPDYFFIASGTDYSFSCLNTKIEEIDQDLYVSTDGDDDNSGLTEDDPLQTIAWAQTLIKRNNDIPNTIHLAEGTYSTSLNNQVFPMNIKQGVIYKGVSTDNTILDAEFEYPFFFQYSRDQNEFSTLILKDLKLTNGECLNESFAGGIVIYQADLHLDNVIIENCNGDWAGSIQTSNGYVNLNNVIIRDNNGQCASSFTIEYNCPNPVRDVKVTNSKIIENQPSIIDPDFPGGGALKIYGHFNIPGSYNAQLTNCQISGNHNASYDPVTGLGGSSGLYLKDMELVDVVNTTFGANTLSHNTGCTISVYNTELNLYNNILYDNVGYSINLWEDAIVNISHSLIEGGNDNVNYYYPLATVNWLDGNLPADANPLWQMSGDYPYMLSENSPCIDAGTLDLPAGIELPEFDLAGNPRIYGETIDMGAYEFQGDPQSIDENVINIPEITQISNYPNPFNPSTTIKLDLAESGKIELVIYNIKGQKVKTLMDAYSAKGHFEIIWKGVDDNKRSVASGQYFIKLKVNGREKAVRKCVLLK